jgi:hypothetical protein
VWKPNPGPILSPTENAPGLLFRKPAEAWNCPFTCI